MDTHAVLTLQLGRALAIYVIAVGLSGLASPTRWKQVMDGYQASPALTYITAVIVFALGLTLVMFHNLWTDPLAIIVSLIAWIILVEGLALMIAPEACLKLGQSAVASPAIVRIWALLTILAGAILLTVATLGHATL